MSRDAIYAAVARIPKGRVASYGVVAKAAGLPRQARQVGYALAALPEGSRVPWHRVVNAQGEISLPGDLGERQRILLALEGCVLEEGRVDRSKFVTSDELQG